MNYGYYYSDRCKLLLLAQERQLHRIWFLTNKESVQNLAKWNHKQALFKDLCHQLDLYFKKKLKIFDVQLCIQGTDFQQQVWRALQKIPYGRTISYGELASTIERPKAMRAVGAAAHKNPFPIIIPCHRLVGSTGALVGFAGGLKLKQALLELEEVIFAMN